MGIRVVAAATVLGVAANWSALVRAASATDAGLEEIVVTAQRREESAQNVAIALSVLSGDALLDKSIKSVVDLQNATPSLQVEPAFGSGQPQYRIRGVGFLDYTSNNASPVGVSVDDVALALPIQTAGQLFDIDRVEVLRGPQGTLYGRNTTGGEINFISNRPTADPHVGFTAEVGSFGELDAQGYASGPLAPQLRGRLSVATQQGNDWQYNRDTGQRLGKQNRLAGRAQLEWTPNDALDFRLTGHWAKDKSEETGLHLIAPYVRRDAQGQITTELAPDTSRFVTDWNLNPVFANLIGRSAGSKPGLDNSNNGVDLAANIDFGPAKLTSITAYNKMIRSEYGDWDATAFHDSDEYFRSDFKVLSQELRLASTGAGALGWVAGVFYSDQTLDEKFYSDFSESPLVGGIALTNYSQKAKSLGEFAQVNYQFSSQWKAAIGVREDHETRELIGLNTGFLVPSIPSFLPAVQSRSTTSNLPSGKFEIDFTPLARTLLYASISRGVKSGGFTAHNTVSTSAVDPFSPEKLTAYELGVKSDVTGTLRINASIFEYQYRDQQILGKVLDAVSQSYIGRFVNANSRLNGGELEIQWQPIRGFSLSQYAGFVEGYYTSQLLNSDTPALDYNGRPLSVPKWTYGGDASYELGVGNYKVTLESNYSFHDTYSQFYLLGSNDFTVPQYWLANANLTLAPSSGSSWSASIWGRNIFNRRYDITRNFFLPTAEIAQGGEPATFGLRLSYKL